MVYISSILPNPSGAEVEKEWIAIGNDGTSAVSLDGWVLKDESGKIFKIKNIRLDGGAEIRFGRPQTKIVLGNLGDEVALYDPTGHLVNSLRYSRAVKSEEIISHSETSAAISMFEPLARLDGAALVSANIAGGFWLNMLIVGAAFASAAFLILTTIRSNDFKPKNF